MKDQVFNEPIKKQFEFDEKVASVFDDMLARSVPFYQQALEISAEFLEKNLEEGARVYDLGCSTASLLLSLERSTTKSLELIGLDNSAAMLEQAEKKLAFFDSKISLQEADILDFNFKKANAFVSNYTLQFIRPLVREKLIQKMYESLEEGGVFIFSEKVITEDKELNKQMIDSYYDFKKTQGYSEFEILQKREALENVLIPYTQEENIKMIKNCGFKHCDVLFRWVNFATFIARK